MRKWLLTLLFCVLAPLCAQAENRALLIGCDYFVTMEQTWPSAENNVRMLGDALMKDARGYSLIRSGAGTVNSADMLEEMILDTFGGAREGDMSVLYISTHGLYRDNQALLVLSDGAREDTVSAHRLKQCFEGILGTKVVLIDACNSGAFIGKGMNMGMVTQAFDRSGFYILTSAGGSEPSWYWRPADDGQASLRGGSYFADMLCCGISADAGYPADADADGTVTLAELYRFLLEYHAASTPQVYPQSPEELPLFVRADEPAPVTRAVTDVVFDTSVLRPGEEITFSFTVNTPSQLLYQLVYFKDGAWLFDSAQQIVDDESAGGRVSVGRKERTLTLDAQSMDSYGYVMLQLFTMDEDTLSLQCSHLLCAQDGELNPDLSVRTNALFSPARGQELTILISHAVPCSLSVSVVNQKGETVRRLCYDTPSRPQQLTPEGSALYWDGRLADGTPAPTGSYTVRVRAQVEDMRYTVDSAPVFLY